MITYDVPIVEPTIDYTKVPPINQKRTLSFVNHFIVHTVTFLNKFALFCEEKLFEFENKLQRVEASLEILESRLSSIPGLEQQSQPKTDTPPEATCDVEEPALPENNDQGNVSVTVATNSENKETKTSQHDPACEKYLKMLRIGVPKAAVKLTMELEGVDSALLE